MSERSADDLGGSEGSKTPRLALLIVNNNSSRAAVALPQVRRIIHSHGFAVEEAACDSAADVSPTIVARRDAIDRVVVCGGDGTVNAAAAGLIETGLPFGIIPLGTANDFARSIAIPSQFEAAVRIAFGSNSRRVDAGEVNGLPFVNVASVGLAAELAERLTKERKRRFGRFSYALTAVRLATTARPFHATLLMDGSSLMVKTFQIAIGNGRYYGGGNVVASEAAVDDARLHLYSLEFSQIWRMALMIRSFPQGSHGALKEVRTADGAEFEVITRKPKPVNADGELLTETPARFTLKRGALTVMVGAAPHPVPHGAEAS